MIDELQSIVERLDWVERAEVRLRKVGHVFFGEVFVTPRAGTADLPLRIREAIDTAQSINWRLHDVTTTLLDSRAEQAGRRIAS